MRNPIAVLKSLEEKQTKRDMCLSDSIAISIIPSSIC